MSIDEAAKLLGERYRKAGENEKVVTIHLFGIDHASGIDGMPLAELASRAGISRTYGTELRKAINLARYVRRI